MSFERQILLSQLDKYFRHELSDKEIYEWALQLAVSENFGSLSQEDPLFKKTIQTLLEMQHMDLAVVPTAKALKYYQHCLKGEEEFIPLKDRQDLKQLNIPDFMEEGPKPHPLQKIKISGKLYFFARAYTMVFGFAILGIYSASLVMPNLVSPGGSKFFGKSSLVESVLHVFYALMILLSPRFMAQKFFFYFTFPMLFLGMIYFWSVPLRLFGNWTMILLALPLTAVPATLAVILLAGHKPNL